MSRGPGALQRRILAELKTHPDHRLSRSELRQLLSGADPANLRRALRSLSHMGVIREEIEDDVEDPITEQWGVWWVILVQPEPLPPDPVLEQLIRELAALTAEP